MSAMWKVAITQREGTQLLMKVTQAQEQSGDFSASLSFVFRALLEPLGLRLADGPLRAAIPERASLDPSYIEAHASDFVASAEMVEEREAFDYDWLVEGLEGEGLKQGEDAFRQRVEAAKESFRTNPPHAVLKVTATDPKWLAHLAPDLTWDSAAYA